MTMASDADMHRPPAIEDVKPPVEDQLIEALKDLVDTDKYIKRLEAEIDELRTHLAKGRDERNALRMRFEDLQKKVLGTAENAPKSPYFPQHREHVLDHS